MYNFFRSFNGFLTVELKGDCAETLLNRAAAKRISFWNLKYRKGCITGNISIKDFKLLPVIVKGLNVKVHILKKNGLPFLTYRYRNRYGIFLGSIMFFTILYLLSQFIWTVDVQGNVKVRDDEILEICEELNIKRGMYSKKLDSYIDAQKLLLKNKKLSWAALNLEGCVLTVNVTEMRSDHLISPQEPCDLKASTDGTILKIDVTAGNVEVKVGDTVRFGDVLVSGIEETVEEGTYFVHSQGVITAKTRRILNSSGTFKQMVAIPNGEIKTHSVLSFFWLDIPLYLGEIKGDYNFVKRKNNLNLWGRELPICLTEKTCYMQNRKEILYSDTELKNKIVKDLKEQIENLKIEEYQLNNEKISYTENGINITWIIDSIENIAVKEKILIAKN
ncbi:MAG: hypothetical protein E7562_03480 [Ruminococcaceae bacterium]|nr:hypothetical protein [Oscillospiraceae bacterium]